MSSGNGRRQRNGAIAAERRQFISDLIMRLGSVSVSDLSEKFGVVENTIRSDLDELVREGKVSRVHGGAVLKTSALPSLPYTETREAHTLEKAGIGAAAVAHVPETGSIYISSGSTAYQFASRIPEGKKIHVLTSALQTAYHLVSARIASVTFLGGAISPETYGSDLSVSEPVLDRLYWDITFMGAAAIDLNRGITTVDIHSADSDRKLIEHGSKLVVLCDSSKFGRFSHAQIGPVSLIDTLITDSGASPDFVSALREMGVEVVVAGQAESG